MFGDWILVCLSQSAFSHSCGHLPTLGKLTFWSLKTEPLPHWKVFALNVPFTWKALSAALNVADPFSFLVLSSSLPPQRLPVSRATPPNSQHTYHITRFAS